MSDAAAPPPSNDIRHDILRRMLSMRRFEEAVFNLRQQELFAGHYHLYIGQEATGAATMAALDAGDMLFSTHRNHGHLIARGGDAGRALAEILGRETGLNRGHGGTFHLADAELGMPHTSALVGGSVPLSAGAAWAMKLAGNDRVGVAFFGDGAVEEGVVFETLNIAQLWQLPVIFVCENNDGAAVQGRSGSFAGAHILDIAAALRMDCHPVDGGDADAVFAQVSAAVAACRRGRGPVFIEALTEPWPGNAGAYPDLVTGVTDISMAWASDAAAGDYAQWYGAVDPVLRLARGLLADGAASTGDLKTLDDAVRQEIQTAVSFAADSPWPVADTG